MKKTYKKYLLIVLTILIVVMIGVLAHIIAPIITEAMERSALKKANDALEIILTDQKDGVLKNGTIIKLGERYFIYEDNTLTVSKDAPDISLVMTMAVIEKNAAAVYLFAEDGDAAAHRTSDGIVYEILLDPDDPMIETYTYSQMNSAVTSFLNEVSYDNDEDSLSKIDKYLDFSERYDRPAGCTVKLKAGELTVFDNGTKNAYTITVKRGEYTFYNITPGVGGEFYIIKGNKVVQRGHLRPTGALRMIYSDTPKLQNMRDLGGWPCDGGTIKYNLLIRGGMVIDTTDTDRNTWVRLLGIDHDIFVKAYSEAQLKGKEEYRTKSPLGEHITLYQKDLSVVNSENKHNFANAKEQMNGIINRLFNNAIAGETTYFHCLAGADRTGMVAIVVEGILGVSKSDVDRDYELTSFNCLRRRNDEGYVADINILKRYPGDTFRDQCIHYLLDCGITLEKINAFRNAVIDGNPEQITELQPDLASKNFCVPEGDGWIDGGRCSSTGADRYDAQSHIVTNYIPVQNGDIVYVKNLQVSDSLYSGVYTFDKKPITGFVMTNQDGKGFVKDISTVIGPWKVFTVDNVAVEYLRLCGKPSLGKDDVIIYIKRDGQWVVGDYGIPVPDYIEENVSTKVVKIIQSYTGVVDKMVWRKF